MKLSRSLLLLLLLFPLVVGCGGGGGGGSGGDTSPPPNSPSSPSLSDRNVLSVTVNGSLCSQDSFLNKACVRVTVCTPGTSTCQTINDILLDTASTGLRIFKQALTIPLTQATAGSGSLAECTQFGDGSAIWGLVQTGDVILGNEPAMPIRIHLIDSTFGTVPVTCGIVDRSPADAGFNGILGVGFFVEDCGSICSNTATNGLYYTCSGSTCIATAVPLAGQVQNPVAFLPEDNNGLTVRLPGIPSAGAPSVDGLVVLGIGTHPNNAPSGATAYGANSFGEFTTVFNGTSYRGLLDTGSNGLFFNSAGLIPNCDPPNSTWFCPASTTNFVATNKGSSGLPSGDVTFQIGNLEDLVASPNHAFANIGGNAFGTSFIWGLPFYYGRTVYLGIEGKASGLGTGPYWAY